MDPLSFSEERFRPSLEERLESIISGAALMADSSCTRDDRRERIVAECNAVRQALQDLLSEYMGNVSVRISLWTKMSEEYFMAVGGPLKKTHFSLFIHSSFIHSLTYYLFVCLFSVVFYLHVGLERWLSL